MFLSLYSNKDMLTMTKDDLHYILGMSISGNIIIPPKCPICGEFVYIDEDTSLGQCSYCNHISKVYMSDKLLLNKEWKQYNVNK